ncbi:MAG: gamma-glutamyl-gamma-aminobutyrate hydrolase family protein [bacterium]
MDSMRVVLSQRQVVGPYGDLRDALEAGYVEFLERHGLIPHPVSNALRDPAAYLADFGRIDGVILTGGNDVCPAEYGEEEIAEGDFSPPRDRTERALLDEALRREIPVLGICRGMQFMNVYFGGRVVQDVPRQTGREGHPPAVDHAVEIVDERMSEWLGGRTVEVNSYHNQAVSEEGLASALKPFAVEPKAGLIEGFYHPELPIAGVQFHPERRPEGDFASSRLIAAFRDRALYWKRR